jgi:hypothetical protein
VGATDGRLPGCPTTPDNHLTAREPFSHRVRQEGPGNRDAAVRHRVVVAGSAEGRGVPVRTEKFTSVMARTVAAAGPASSSRPSWVEWTVWCTELLERAASWSWAPSQPSVPVLAEAVSTASGRSSNVVSACAWAKTSWRTETSSRWFR